MHYFRIWVYQFCHSDVLLCWLEHSVWHVCIQCKWDPVSQVYYSMRHIDSNIVQTYDHSHLHITKQEDALLVTRALDNWIADGAVLIPGHSPEVRPSILS